MSRRSSLIGPLLAVALAACGGTDPVPADTATDPGALDVVAADASDDLGPDASVDPTDTETPSDGLAQDAATSESDIALADSETVLDSGTDARADEPEVDAAEPGPPCSNYSQPQPEGQLAPGIDEASGLVVSARDPEILWTHNDSGGEAHLFALSKADGSLVADLSLPSLTAIDWEDLSNGPCAPGAESRDCLYVGDFGDNQSKRSNVAVHRIVEPEGPSGTMSVGDVETMVLVYPDGARDCEAMVVDDQANIWLLSKEWGIGTFRVYTAPFAASEAPVTLTYVSEHEVIGIPGELLSILTGADYRPDLRPDRLIVRLYQVALEYRLGPGGLAAIGEAERVIVPNGADAQGESIAYDDDGYRHTSEGLGAPIWFVPCAD